MHSFFAWFCKKTTFFLNIIFENILKPTSAQKKRETLFTVAATFK